VHLIKGVMQPRVWTRRTTHPNQRVRPQQPSPTAHEIAERNTNQRADTVATDNPHDCHQHAPCPPST
jgi:hypothetical protein